MRGQVSWEGCPWRAHLSDSGRITKKGCFRSKLHGHEGLLPSQIQAGCTAVDTMLPKSNVWEKCPSWGEHTKTIKPGETTSGGSPAKGRETRDGQQPVPNVCCFSAAERVPPSGVSRARSSPFICLFPDRAWSAGRRKQECDSQGPDSERIGTHPCKAWPHGSPGSD